MTTLKRYTGTQWETVGLPNNVGMSPQTLGFAENRTVADQVITAGALITGLSVTVTVPAGRRIRITSKTNSFSSTAEPTTDSVEYSILEDGVAVERGCQNVNSATENVMELSVVRTPSAGTHTYTVFGTRHGGGGTVSSRTQSTQSSWLLVEDVTGSTLPYQPASVPVGVLARAPQTVQQTGIGSTLTDVTALTASISVPAGRTIKITADVIVIGNSAAESKAAIFIMEGATKLGFGEESLNDTPDNSSNVHAECIISPSAGAHTYKVAVQFSSGAANIAYADPANGQNPFLLIEDITPTPAPSSGAPGSTLGYAEVTANQTGISALADLTGLAVTVTVPAGRRLRILGHVHQFTRTAGTVTYADLRVREGTTELNRATSAIPNTYGGADAIAIVSPSAGTHTYKLSASSDGTVTSESSASNPAYILVEDITGSVWPLGSQVTSALVASEPWTPYVPILGQGVTTDVAKNTAYARYYRIGRIVTVQFYLIVTGTGTASSSISVSLPFTGVAIGGAGDRMIIGTGQIFDASANNFYQGIAAFSNGTGSGAVLFYPTDIVAGVGSQFIGLSAMTAALAAGDVVTGSVTYEAAS